MAMLDVRDLQVSYGVIRAIKGITFQVNKGEIVTLIGANGAGKTTTLHTLSGLLRPVAGSITYNPDDNSPYSPILEPAPTKGYNLVATEASKIIHFGLAQVPEGRRVFAQMSVKENLEMGAFARKESREALRKDYKEVYELLPRLYERRNQVAGTLSGGEQQMLAIGRALMSNPTLLLLDEPSMGLAPLLVQEIFNIIRQVNNQGTTILLVEQNAKKALEIANRGYVLETGRIVMQGDAKELAKDPEVKRAYLGGLTLLNMDCA